MGLLWFENDSINMYILLAFYNNYSNLSEYNKL